VNAADGADLARRSRAAQQLPEHVEDTDVLAQIAATLNGELATTPDPLLEPGAADTNHANDDVG
jgi:hypothetical protein